MEHCPKCKCVQIAAGEVPVGAAFFPAGLKHWKLLNATSVQFKDTFRACLECGLVWNEADPAGLTKVLSDGVTEDPKRKLGLL